MDAKDFLILNLLLQDGRMSYEKIARKVNLSSNTVKNRIDKLVQMNVIQRFTTYLNPILFNQSICFSLATVKEGTIQGDLVELISQWNEVVGITISVENVMSIVHHFQNTNQMHETVEKLKTLPEILDVKNYILLLPDTGEFSSPSKITETDWRIIKILRDNCRKTDTELAAELQLSPKTVKRRIRYLKNNGIIVFLIEIDTASGDLITYELILTLKQVTGTVLSAIQATIPDIFYVWRVANAEVLIITVQINHLSAIEDHIKKLRTMPEIFDIETYVPTRMYYPPGWYDHFIEEQIDLHSK